LSSGNHSLRTDERAVKVVTLCTPKFLLKNTFQIHFIDKLLHDVSSICSCCNYLANFILILYVPVTIHIQTLSHKVVKKYMLGGQSGNFMHPHKIFQGAYKWGVYKGLDLGLLCLTSLSTKFQLYFGSQFYWWKKSKYPEKTTDLSHVTKRRLKSSKDFTIGSFKSGFYVKSVKHHKPKSPC
jgi:hypothetical protein